MARKPRFPKSVASVTISGMADRGYCVGRDPGGQVYFVEGVVPGDVADIVVFKKRKGAFFARATRLLTPSADRVTPFCQHFYICGGCKWQHLDYDAQVREKEKIVHDAFRRIGHVSVAQWEPALGAPAITYYRNKLEYGCANRRWLTTAEIAAGVDNEQDIAGFHRAGAYDKLIEIEHCWLQPDPSNALRNGVAALAREQGMPFFDMRHRTGLLRQLMIRTSSLGQTMALLAFYHDDQAAIQRLLAAVRLQFPTVTTLLYCINSKVNEYLMDLDMLTYDGPGYIEEQLGQVRFRIGPKSFFQTNTGQAEHLYNITADYASLTGQENVYDLYTGIGSIALYVADRCRHVTGIEEIPEAIEDARQNAHLNGITNATFYAGDVKDILTEDFAQQHGKPDVLITDPPRAGMHPKVVATLLQLAAPRLVYVSCNAATQARDLQLLSDRYRVVRARPVDMFPHTSHIENVALLELRTT